MALYDHHPNSQDSKLNQFLNFIGNIFTILYTIEAILKIIALGFILHKHAYLRSLWNILDFIIVVTG